MPAKIAAGNWKMNGTAEALGELEKIAAFDAGSADVVICPPATLIERAAARAGAISIGGQDCHTGASGAHTGDISADMLKDAGATHVILGHSERRADHAESDALIAAKSEAAWTAGLVAIICVGETLQEREADETLRIVAAQLKGSVPDAATATNTIIAYEPVWAIGTGKVATPVEIGEVHHHIRALLAARFATEGAEMSLLYGGSVKPGNAAEIFSVEDVDGALVGGASLKATDFTGIISALDAS